MKNMKGLIIDRPEFDYLHELVLDSTIEYKSILEHYRRKGKSELELSDDYKMLAIQEGLLTKLNTIKANWTDK